ncbi:unnamed protein product [Strongylus vulgaris]|uniref:Uncharacterized protein n=1 Tax=Strongylus vulgaris TaxID=40348 RepID=A0A3P7IPE9_STRVU|nr:unnamed protein product [Strongylus vulgaris]
MGERRGLVNLPRALGEFLLCFSGDHEEKSGTGDIFEQPFLRDDAAKVVELLIEFTRKRKLRAMETEGN